MKIITLYLVVEYDRSYAHALSSHCLKLTPSFAREPQTTTHPGPEKGGNEWAGPDCFLSVGEIQNGLVKTTLVPGSDRMSGQCMARLVITRISGAFIPQEFAPFHDPMVNCADALQEPVASRGRYSREPAFNNDLLFRSPRS
jgi:hypothetical protein